MATVVVRVPRRLYERIVERGIDLEEKIVEALLAELDADPEEEALIRVELAERLLEEARELLGKGDAVQASEKMYKVVEECIKALARLYDIPERRRAIQEGRWWTQLLGKASRRLARLLNEPRLELVWSLAYEIHVWGFHEAKYSVEDVRGDLEHVKWILDYTKKHLEHLGSRKAQKP